MCLCVCGLYSSTHRSLNVFTGLASPYDVRLVGSTMNGVGAVEIYSTDLNWISVCPDSSVFSDGVANAVCLQLGYESGEAMTFM